MSKSTRDVSAEFVELMCRLDVLCDQLDDTELWRLTPAARGKVDRVRKAHRAFRDLCWKHDAYIIRTPPDSPLLRPYGGAAN